MNNLLREVIQNMKLRLGWVKYPSSHCREVMEPEFKTQDTTCLTSGPILWTILLCWQTLEIQRRKRVTDVQELGQAPLVPDFLDVKYRYGLHLFFGFFCTYAQCHVEIDNMLNLEEEIESNITFASTSLWAGKLLNSENAFHTVKHLPSSPFRKADKISKCCMDWLYALKYSYKLRYINTFSNKEGIC